MPGNLTVSVKLIADVSGFRAEIESSRHALEKLAAASTTSTGQLSGSASALETVGTAGRSAATQLSGSASALVRSNQQGAAAIRQSSTAMQGLARDAARTSQSSTALVHANEGVAKSYAGLKGAIASIGGFALAREIVQTGVAFDGLQRSMKAVFGTSQAAAQEWKFVRGEADRLGLNLEKSAKAYTKFSAAARGTSLEGQQAREIFTAVSEASAALSLSADDTEGALTALEQMISKGVVCSEELKEQLGERLPGAFATTASAMGYTTQQFTKLLESGSLTADKVLPALAASLRKLYSKDAASAGESARGQIERLRNEIMLAEVAFANSGFLDGVTAGVKALSTELKSAAVQDSLKAMGSSLGSVISYAATHGDQLKMLAEAYAVFKVASLVVDGATVAMKLYTGATIGATAAQKLFNSSVAANPYVRAALLIATAVTAVAEYTDALNGANGAAADAAKASEDRGKASKSEAEAERDAARAAEDAAKAKQKLADQQRAAALNAPLKSIEAERDALLDITTAQEDAAERAAGYAGAVRALKQDLDAGKITQDQYADALAKVGERFKQTKLNDYVQGIAQEVGLLKLSSREREVAIALREAEDKAQSDGNKLTDQQRQAIAALVVQKQRLNEVDAKRKEHEEDYRNFVKTADEDIKQLTMSQTEWELYQAAQRGARLRQQAQGDTQALAKIDEWYAAKKAQVIKTTEATDDQAAQATKQRLDEVSEAHSHAVEEQERSQEKERSLAEELTRLHREAADDEIDTTRAINEAHRKAEEDGDSYLSQQVDLLSRLVDARQEAADQEREIYQRIADDRRQNAENAKKFADEQVQIAKDLAEAESDYAATIAELTKSKNAELETGEQKIREIRRRDMDEAGQQADIEAEAAERILKARQALASGDLDTARSEGERAQSLAETLKNQAAAIAMIQQSAQVLNQVKQAEISAGQKDAQTKLAEARVAAAEKEKQLQIDIATARDEAARREAENTTALSKVRATLATQEQAAIQQLLILQNKMSLQAEREAETRQEIKTRIDAAQKALAEGDTEEAKRQGEKIKSLGEQLTKENEVRDAIQSGAEIIAAARQKQVEKTTEAATAQAAYTEQVRAEATETGNVVARLTEMVDAHDKAAAAAEQAAARQKTSIGAIEQSAAAVVAKEKEIETGYAAGTEAARRAADDQVASISRIIDTLDRVQSKARDTASSLASVSNSAPSSGSSFSLFGSSFFANGGIMTSAGPLPLKMYANGGIARSPQVAVYGEGHHPEAYVPLPDGRSIPVTLQGGGDTISITATINVDGDVDPDQLLTGLIDAARRRSARGLASLSVEGGR